MPPVESVLANFENALLSSLWELRSRCQLSIK
jgi:hypothetical protein